MGIIKNKIYKKNLEKKTKIQKNKNENGREILLLSNMERND